MLLLESTIKEFPKTNRPELRSNEAADRRCSVKKVFLKICRFHKKIPMPESYSLWTMAFFLKILTKGSKNTFLFPFIWPYCLCREWIFNLGYCGVFKACQTSKMELLWKYLVASSHKETCDNYFIVKCLLKSNLRRFLLLPYCIKLS